MSARPGGLLTRVGPGLLVAATGVGAGDLATAAFTGGVLGTAVLWAVLAGAFVKFVLNEGLARWQLATGTTLLEGIVTYMGRPARWIFLAYLGYWSLFTGAALMSACGAAAHAILPIFEDAKSDKILYGLLHSAAGVFLVWRGGFALFEKVMSLAIAFMVLTVLGCAIALTPDLGALAKGFAPHIPDAGGKGLEWTLALMGGIGGTLTVLCYGYWMREQGREGVENLKPMRFDLAIGYTMTAVFGIAMLVIGSQVATTGSGVNLLVDIAARLERELGLWASWAFRLGAWAAVASSLLGVWQAGPYLFADVVRLKPGAEQGVRVDEKSKPYRTWLLLLATVPAIGLLVDFRDVQKYTALLGALVMPALCVVLLWLCGRRAVIGSGAANRAWTNAALAGALAFFVWATWVKLA